MTYLSYAAWVLWILGYPDQARKRIGEALNLAQDLSHPFSLAFALWQQQGKKAEARQMLADVYNWFTEGFDTKDLQEAKELLESL